MKTEAAQKSESQNLKSMETLSELSRIQIKEFLQKKVVEFNLMSDVFMSVALDDPESCEYVIRVLTGKQDLKIREVRSQYTISRTTSHGARLDILAEDGSGRLYNLEIQRSDTVKHPYRVRFYKGMIDSEMLMKGKDYDELPEISIFYLSETDIFHTKSTVSYVRNYLETDRIVGEHSDDNESKIKIQGETSRKVYEDGMHVTYINAEVDDGSEIARMMRYFLTADPEDDSHGALSKRIHFLKKEEGGQEIMCKISDEIYEMGRSLGEAVGEERGIMIGEERGIVIGESKGEEKMSELILKLISDNRGAEIGRAAEDQVYRAALMREYSLA